MKAALLPVVLFVFSGCFSSSIAYDTHRFIMVDDLKVPKNEVRSAWFEHIASENPRLHDILIRSMSSSQKTGKRIYITRRVNNRTPYYTMDLESQGGSSVMSVDWGRKMIQFDYYNRSDGLRMSHFEKDWFKYDVREKAKLLNDLSGIGDFD